MIEALIEGTTDAEALADLARGLLRKKLTQLQAALLGRVQSHQQLLLRHLLAHLDFLEDALEKLRLDIETHLTPFEEQVTLLQSIPGVQAKAAAVIVAEIGVEMDRFPSAKHLASWAGVCPGNLSPRQKLCSRKRKAGK